MKNFTSYANQYDVLNKAILHSLDIELTERCNNNCIHCCINLPVNDQDAEKNEMSFEEIKEILNQASDLGCVDLRLTGGEPLLRSDFEDIYIYARNIGMRVLIFTNARLITQRLALLFSQIPPLKKIEVTAYGMHEVSYAENTQKQGAFNSFERGVHNLQDYNVPFIIKSAFLPANRAEHTEFVNWAKSIPWMDGKPSYSLFFNLRNRNENRQKNEKIKSLRISPKEGIKFLLNYYTQEYIQLKNNYWQNIDNLPGTQLFRCSAGDHQLTVDAYGRIQPCLELRAPNLVLPRGTSLKNALDKFKELKNLEAKNAEYLSRCAKCFLKNLCQQCPAKSWSENGTLDTPIEYYCKVTHTLARSLGWLEDSEFAWEVKDWKVRIQPH